MTVKGIYVANQMNLNVSNNAHVDLIGQVQGLVGGENYPMTLFDMDPNVAGMDEAIRSAVMARLTSDYGYSWSAGDTVKLVGAPIRTQGAATRSLNSAFQISAFQDALVNYSVDISCTLSLTGGQTGTVFLEIANDSGFTSGVQEIGRTLNANTGTLTIGLNITQSVTGQLSGYVPVGKYVRIRTANTAGSPSFNWRSGQEALL